MAIRTYVDGGVLGGVGKLWRFNTVQYVYNVTRETGTLNVHDRRSGASTIIVTNRIGINAIMVAMASLLLCAFASIIRLPLRACAFHEAF